jgi:hypothetical protein
MLLGAPVRLPAFIKTRAPSLALVVVVLCGASALLAVALGKDVNWDLLNYHYYNGYAFLGGRSQQDIAPAQLQTFLNPLLDIPLYLAIAHISPVAVGALWGLVQGLNAVAVWLIGNRVLPVSDEAERGWAALGVALVSIPSAGNIGELGGSMGDNLASIPTLFAAALVVRSYPKLESASPKGVLLESAIAGVFAGVAAGLKLTALLYAAAFCIGCLFLVRPVSRRLLVATGFGLGVLAGWLGLSGFWLWELWTRFQSPFFPFFNNVFRSDWAPTDVVRDDRWFPHSLFEFVTFPIVWTFRPSAVAENPFRDLRMPFAYVLVVVLALRGVVRRLRRTTSFELPTGPVAFVAVGAVLSYGVWLSMWAYFRYLGPVEWLAPLGIALALFELVPRARWGTLAIAVLALTTLTTKPLTYGRGGWGSSYFDAKIPELPADPPGLVLIAGLEPLGFLVPYFPSELRFVRIEGMRLGGARADRFDGLVRETVAAHSGNFFVLYPGQSLPPESALALEKLGFSTNLTHCSPVRVGRPSPPPYGALRPGYVTRDLLPPIAICSLTRGRS